MLNYSIEKGEMSMEDEGNVFELIAEECYYDDKWEEEKWKKTN